jgi:hypothetical protein
MLKPNLMFHLVLLSSLISSVSFAADAIKASTIPKAVKTFIDEGSNAIEVKSADLNGDGLDDYLVVTENKDGDRSLLIISTQSDGKFKLEKRSDAVVMCKSCGGVLGDPFSGVQLKLKSFTVNHSGGSADRWANSFTFNYSRRDKTWQLVRVEEMSYHTARPNKISTQQFTPPKDFGKIDIEEFDPDHFKGQGER